MDPITFKAIIADSKSAITFSSDGGRVVLEVPESDVAGLANLIRVRNRRLLVTVALLDKPTD